MVSKNKTRIIVPYNRQDKMPNNIVFESKIHSNPDISIEPKGSSSLDETSASPNNITPKLDMRTDLKLESLAKNKKDYKSD